MGEPAGFDAGDEPLPGKVLYLDDPYCWYSHADVRPFLNRPAYAVRIDRPSPSPERPEGER